MPKRRRSDGRGGGRTARRHLYLVLDDWSLGYSIRKVDLSSNFDCDDSGQLIAGEGKQRLPSAIFRFEAQRGLPMYFAAAFGTKLIAMHPIAPLIDGTLPLVPRRSVPVFDVRIRSVIFGPRQRPNPVDPIYIPVGGRLFALSTRSFALLYPPPAESGMQTQGWVWSWYELPTPPFRRKYVTPEALMDKPSSSASRRAAHPGPSALTHHLCRRMVSTGSAMGRMLPFTGCAHFDCVLDAWVGLSREPGTIGQLCSCDVVSTNSDNRQCPTVKLCKEKLFSEHPVLRALGATLLYMGSRSEFCLVEFVSVGDMNDGELEAASGCLLRVTTFFLIYDKNGNLTTGKQGRVRCYGVPGAVSEPILKCPVAFLM